MYILPSILIGISLSMDTFSLSLLCGTLNTKKQYIYILSIIVGIYHFFMPLLGLSFGSLIINNIFLEPEHILSIIFSIIGIQMILSIKKEEKNNIIFNLVGMLLFGFTVSIDSFSTGIGLNIINPNTIEAVLIFSVISTIFTYLGLTLGKKLNQKYGNYSIIIGGILLVLLALYYLTK